MTTIEDLATAAATSKRGAFIVLEGLDCSGKTTQVQLLEQRFKDAAKPVKMMRFPGQSPVPLFTRFMLIYKLDRSTVIGQMIDGYLKSDVEMEDHVIHLLFSANRWEAAYVSLTFALVKH